MSTYGPNLQEQETAGIGCLLLLLSLSFLAGVTVGALVVT